MSKTNQTISREVGMAYFHIRSPTAIGFFFLTIIHMGGYYSQAPKQLGKGMIYSTWSRQPR